MLGEFIFVTLVIVFVVLLDFFRFFFAPFVEIFFSDFFVHSYSVGSRDKPSGRLGRAAQTQVGILSLLGTLNFDESSFLRFLRKEATIDFFERYDGNVHDGYYDPHK